jgi:hypothetical protein
MKGAVLVSLLAFGVVAGALAFTRRDHFPHEQHARLFPLCTGCHEGITTNDSSRFYPAPTLCAGCHNGTELDRVSWNRPGVEPSNLKFSHTTHNDMVELDCSDCHTREGAGRMAVEHAVAARCFSCHEATNHLADAQCEQCHIPLARTALPVARIEHLPAPPSHQEPTFLERLHGELSRSNQQACIVCHTRERCAACHVDAASRAEISAMPAVQPPRALPAMKARYFVPASHTRTDWLEAHGGAARDIASCSACHTRESCMTCHATKTPSAIRGLPQRASGAAPGVSATRRAPASHRAPFFERRHGAVAASQKESCVSCHARTECEDCHNAARAGQSAAASQSKSAGFHPANFLQRHAGAAFGRTLECANCHETSRFCRDCHERTGMGTAGRLEAGFHDAQPFWLLNHGKPARQGLESCATCHKQTDCMQCHSDLGAFRVSPHGPGFNAKRVQNRNARLCFACHLGDPLARTTQ